MAADLMELAQPVGVLGRRTCWVGLDPLVVDTVVMPAAGCALRAGPPRSGTGSRPLQLRTGSGSMSRRLLAMAALVVGAATIVLALWVAVSEFPRGLLLLGCILVAVAAAWYGLLRRGTVRVVGLLVAALALVGAPCCC